MSTFRDPVIGDEFDLETYGRPSAQRTSAQRSSVPRQPQPRAHASYDRSAARARRVNSHRPITAEPIPRTKPSEATGRSRIDANGVRTVKISGQATPARSRSAQRSLAAQIDRYDRRPDRAAQWALFMGIFMIAVAIVTGT